MRAASKNCRSIWVNIRKKLGARPGEKNYIVNELGVGYRMCEADEETL